jgi:putative ABC transport system permease protein
VERRLSIDSIAEFDNNPTVTLHFIDDNHISTCKLVEGEEFTLDKDGVWIDSLFAQKKGLAVGDTVKFNMNGFTIEKEIMGTVMSPEYVYAAKVRMSYPIMQIMVSHICRIRHFRKKSRLPIPIF